MVMKLSGEDESMPEGVLRLPCMSPVFAPSLFSLQQDLPEVSDGNRYRGVCSDFARIRPANAQYKHMNGPA